MKTPAQLTSLYYQSVGRGATLLLNVPPNRDGLLSAEDIASLQDFGAYLKATFSQNLAARATADATHVRGNDKQFGPAHLLDGRPDTYWATDDNVTSADVTFDLGRPLKFQVIRLKEAIRLRAARRRVHRGALAIRFLGARLRRPPASGRDV